jgi:tRNA 2-thiouridine synthesizing protein A
MTKVLDTKGLQCPLPVLKARKALKDLAPGELLTVLATDPASYIDFRHFCDTNGHELVDHAEVDGVYTYVIRRGG